MLRQGPRHMLLCLSHMSVCYISFVTHVQLCREISSDLSPKPSPCMEAPGMESRSRNSMNQWKSSVIKNYSADESKLFYSVIACLTANCQFISCLSELL